MDGNSLSLVDWLMALFLATLSKFMDCLLVMAQEYFLLKLVILQIYNSRFFFSGPTMTYRGAVEVLDFFVH